MNSYFSIELVLFWCNSILICVLLNLIFSRLARAYQTSPNIDNLLMFGSRFMCFRLDHSVARKSFISDCIDFECPDQYNGTAIASWTWLIGRGKPFHDSRWYPSSYPACFPNE